MELLKTYSNYKRSEPEYLAWKESLKAQDAHREDLSQKNPPDAREVGTNTEKARILARALNMVDEYAQTKAEDVEAISQTVQIQAVGFFSCAGYLLGNLFANKTSMGRTFTKFLEGKMGRLKSAAPSILPAAAGTLFGVLAFIPVVIHTVKEQVRFTRMARFEGLQKEAGHINDYAILSDEQKKEAKKIAEKMKNDDEKREPGFNIFAILRTAKELYIKKADYEKTKLKYDEIVNGLKDCPDEELTEDEIKRAKKEQFIINKLIEKVEHDSQEPIMKVETLVNIGYSSLFVGGYLEYLLSEKLVDMMKVKNPVLKNLMKFGIPIVTYLILNKQLAEFHNDTLKTVKYKKMQELINNPKNMEYFTDEQIKSETGLSKKPKENPQSLFAFYKEILKDMKEYNHYRKTEFNERKKLMKAERQIVLTEEQEEDAKRLRRAAFVAFNKHDDLTQKYMEVLEAVTEVVVIANDLIAGALGAGLGWVVFKMKNLPPHKENLYKGIGSITALVPMILTQMYATKEQRQAVAVGQMQVLNDLTNVKYFTKRKTPQQDTDTQSNTFMAKIPPKERTVAKNIEDLKSILQ